eukprot:TRINITY_DN1165_c1_g4_i1.p1 TRINITY_DN1165_c1_g4~~TRINITY_DN1165_c1_g4_i1.p1  ORF type:complete len:430 (-),score=34.16 TRINITY_DN1165_c1_g4_i1:2573-3742(-)
MKTDIKLPATENVRFFTSEVQGVAVRWVTVKGRHLLALPDLGALTGYRPDSVKRLYALLGRYGYNLRSQLKLRPPGLHGAVMNYVDVQGLQLVCAALPQDRTIGVREWLAERSGLPLESFIPEDSHAQVFITQFAGKALCMAHTKGQVWIEIRDAAPALGYRTRAAHQIRNLCKHNGVNERHQIALRCSGSKPRIFISAEGLRQVCDLIQPQARAAMMRKWLERYGDWSATATELMGELSGRDARDAVVVPARSNGAALQAAKSRKARRTGNMDHRRTRAATAPASSAEERTAAAQLSLPGVAAEASARPISAPRHSLTAKEYCRKLCTVLTRYLTDDEVGKLLSHMEGVKGDVLASRYDPLLNDAAYALFANYRLRSAQAVASEQGGA